MGIKRLFKELRTVTIQGTRTIYYLKNDINKYIFITITLVRIPRQIYKRTILILKNLSFCV